MLHNHECLIQKGSFCINLISVKKSRESHHFSSYEIPPALPQFSGYRISEREEKINIKTAKMECPPKTIYFRQSDWIATKHLWPAEDKWARVGNEIRFWNISERAADILVKRMINCLDCGFCMVECFPCRQFDRTAKSMQITGCIQCGKCLQLKFCMGWRHRFWRRVIVEN